MSFISLSCRPLIALALLAGGMSQANAYSLDDDLIYRINFGSADDVRVLLDKGANPNAKTDQGDPALDVALERNDKETQGMAKALIDKGADVNAPDKDGIAPIINAIHYKEPGVVKMLLAKGADYHIQATDPSGNKVELMDFAQKYGDTESAQAIGMLIGKEMEDAASLRTPARFKKIMHSYAMDSCAYQYWSFFLSSKQDPSRDDEINKKVADLKASINNSITQIQQYYPGTSTTAMESIAKSAVDSIFGILDGMVSNSNRHEQGIGKEADAEDRCTKIVTQLDLDIMPAPGSSQNAPQSAPTPPKPSSVQSSPAGASQQNTAMPVLQ